MIAVKIEGRLGNQLFQYAFIYSASKKLNTNFYIDKSVDYLLLDKYFAIENDFCRALDNYVFSIKGFKLIFSHYFRKAFYYLLQKLLLLREEVFYNNETPASQLHKVANNRMYLGHFQSIEYFFECKADIKRLFSIKPVHQIRFDAIMKTLPKAEKYVTVHVRRGDYINLKWALDNAYYHKAIKTIHDEDNYYIFISDDAEFVKNEFNYLNNKYVSENDEITDLQFLINAPICILSSSSFSWWGAWLNNNKNKKIYAPQNWLGFKEGKEFPPGISCHTNFNWIEV